MRLLYPIPRRWSRALTIVILAGWLTQMGALIKRTYLQAGPASLAADLAQYGAGAQWKGVYYRGAKIGFFATQMKDTGDGFRIQEDGRLQLLLLGMTSAARVQTTVDVDRSFILRSFTFSLDPGTGKVEVSGRVVGRNLELSIRNASGARSETRTLAEAPALSLNLARQIALQRLKVGARFQIAVFDPATLRNSDMDIEVVKREVLFIAGQPLPVYRLETRFSGLKASTWMTELGEVVREESPMGLIVVKESQAQATALAVPGSVQVDLLRAAAVVPRRSRFRIDDPASVDVLRVRLSGDADLLTNPDLRGAGQRVDGDQIEIQDGRLLSPGPIDPERVKYLAPEPLIESDDPAIRAEAQRAVAGLTTPRQRAERLVRHVHALIEKRPTVGLPSATEVLRTRVGDCNEHTALYVALARAAGVPARVAVGLVHLLGAFYYHAWAEVYLEESPGRGLWLPADPTLNQFPADATHIRFARGGLDKQVLILGLLGKLQLSIEQVTVRPGYSPVLVGRAASDLRPLEIELPKRAGDRRCWSRPAP
jgi:transglutaminase-like putative cysteine protease